MSINTQTATEQKHARRSQLDRDVAMRLAATQYGGSGNS